MPVSFRGKLLIKIFWQASWSLSHTSHLSGDYKFFTVWWVSDKTHPVNKDNVLEDVKTDTEVWRRNFKWVKWNETFLSVTDYNSNLTCLVNFVVLENSFLLVALQISCGSYPKKMGKETLKYYKFCLIYISIYTMRSTNLTEHVNTFITSTK